MANKFIIGVVVLLAGGTGWLLHHYSDTEVIRRKFTSIAVTLGKEGEDSPVMLALKMKSVKDFIAPACKVIIPENNYQEVLAPDLVIRYLIIYRSRQTSLDVAVDKILIDIPDKGIAGVSAQIHVTANLNRPDFFDEVHHVKFSLQKQEKTWLLHEATLPDALVHRH